MNMLAKKLSRFMCVAVLVAGLIGCGEKKETPAITINGVFENGAGEYVYLYRFATVEPVVADSALIAEDGSFALKTSDTVVNFFTIGMDGNNAAMMILTPGESIEVKANANRVPNDFQVSGSVHSELIQTYVKRKMEMIKAQEEFTYQMSKLDFNDTINTQVILDAAQVEKEKFNAFKLDFIANNANSPALYITMYDLDDYTELEQIKKVEKALHNSVKGSVFHESMIQRVQMAEAQIAYKEAMEKKQNALAIGSEAPELNFPNPDGKKIALSSLRGKVVLIDFWAAWCRPCRAENPNVVRLYKKYNKKGFDVYSFSLDQQKEQWLAAIEMDGLIWKNHVSDLAGWNTAAIPLYHFDGIPFTVLIDRDGKIIGKNLRGPELENKLKEIFGS
ncbi:MAG: redoxin domain-containing protein [Flavobacteriales bacterium]